MIVHPTRIEERMFSEQKFGPIKYAMSGTWVKIMVSDTKIIPKMSDEDSCIPAIVLENQAHTPQIVQVVTIHGVILDIDANTVVGFCNNVSITEKIC